MRAAHAATDSIQATNQKDRALDQIAKAEIKAGDLRAARVTIQGIQATGMKDIGLTQVGLAQARTGDRQAARETIGQIRSSDTRKRWLGRLDGSGLGI